MHACNTNRSHVKNFRPGISSARTWRCILTLRQHSGLTYKVIQAKCHIPQGTIPHPQCCKTLQLTNFHPLHVHTQVSSALQITCLTRRFAWDFRLLQCSQGLPSSGLLYIRSTFG
jgi:hypothetical protein